MQRVCVVTGGTVGIGKACVEKFEEEGYQVFNLDIQADDNERSLVCDVTKADQVSAAIQHIYNTAGRIDTLICNAGIHFSATIEKTTAMDLDRVLDINVKGVYHAIQAVLPYMKSATYGRIVLMGSDQSSVAKPNSFAYNLSKAAIGSITKTTAIDYAHYGIGVNAVCPGSIETPLLHNAIDRYCERTGEDKAQVMQEERDAQVMKRLGQPKEVAELAFLLGSDKAEFMTGGLHAIDGGYTAR